MWKFLRRLARPAKGPPPPRERARVPYPSSSARLQVEALEDRFSPGGLLGSPLDLSLEASALFWQGPEGVAASRSTLHPGADNSSATPRSGTNYQSTDLDSLGGAAPLPIPGEFPAGVHGYLPGPADSPPPFGNEPNTITDFNGQVAVANIDGIGTALDTTTGATSTLLYDVDVRIMQGVYRGVDGDLHTGTFALL